MKVVAINGSPRKGGNTEQLLLKVLEPIQACGIETELIQIGGKKSTAVGHAISALRNRMENVFSVMTS